MTRKKHAQVVLKKDLLRWPKLPAPVRAALVEGTENIRQLRDEIGRDARVSVMPPVQVVAEIWTDPNRRNSLNGRATVLRVKNSNMIGVQLPAVPVVSRDSAVLRAILVHEFSHCFFMLIRVVNHMDSGGDGTLQLPRTENVFEDQEFDRRMHIDPREWFGAADAQRLMQQFDPLMEGIDEGALELELFHHLPIVTPDSEFGAEKLFVPDDIVEHVRRLRAM